MISRLIKFFGSLKLAVVLLTALTVIMAVATFYESKTSTRMAVLNIYQSWWFNALLVLLVINVAAAALTRWPWKRKHVGFVITHAGIIVTLIGCSAQFHYGTEGMLEMRVGNPPASLVRLDDEALTVVVPETGQRTKTVVRIRKDGSVNPSVFQVSENLRLTIDGSIPNSRLEQVVREGGAEANPAVRFRLQSESTGQDVRDWLIAFSREKRQASFGPAQIEFVVATDEDALKRLLAPPDETVTGQPELEIWLDRKRYVFPVAANADKHLNIGETGLSAHIVGYWPDFQLDENHKPTSVSDEPNNPAAVVILTQGGSEERYFVFGDQQMAPIIRTIRGDAIGADVLLKSGKERGLGSSLMLVLAPDNTLHYAAQSKSGFKSGTLELGETISPGWMDFQFTAEKFAPNAVVGRVITPAPVDPQGGYPALKVTAHIGGELKSEWVRFGEPTVIEASGKTVHMMYSWDSMQLPFTVALEDFIVERDEGSMNVGGWTAKVAFHDHARGLTQRAAIWMNNPGWFGGYKFAQSSWNPNDLKYTALQVKKDPRFVTWLTWAGAILIVGGITVMFWFRRWLGPRNGQGRGAEAKPSTGSTTTAREEEMVRA